MTPLYVLSAIVCGLVFEISRERSLRLQARRYEETIRILTEDRDAAREEARIFRGIICPTMNRKEGQPGPELPKPGQLTNWEQFKIPTPTKAKTETLPPAKKPAVAQSFYCGRNVKPAGQRLPFRILFNQARQAMNSKQKKTDALASALSQVKTPQEKSNGTATAS